MSQPLWRSEGGELTLWATAEEREAEMRKALLEGANYIFEWEEGSKHGLSVGIVSYAPEGQIWYDPELGIRPCYVPREHFAFQGHS